MSSDRMSVGGKSRRNARLLLAWYTRPLFDFIRPSEPICLFVWCCINLPRQTGPYDELSFLLAWYTRPIFGFIRPAKLNLLFVWCCVRLLLQTDPYDELGLLLAGYTRLFFGFIRSTKPMHVRLVLCTFTPSNWPTRPFFYQD